MDWDAVFYAAIVAALLLPATLAGWLTARAGRMRPAWRLALALLIAGTAAFAIAGLDGQTPTESLPWVLLATVIFIPWAIAAVVGGVVGRLIGRR